MGTQLKIVFIIVGVLMAAGATGLGLYYGTQGDSEEAAAGSGEQQVAAAPSPAEADPKAAAGDSLPSDSAQAPSFDVIRVEPTGEIVAAGRASAGSRVGLLLADEAIGEAETNESGEWAMVADEPLAPGSYDLLLRATGTDGTAVDGDRVTIVIEAPDRTPLVAIAPPGAPTRVLQQPGSAGPTTLAASPKADAEPSAAAPSAESPASGAPSAGAAPAQVVQQDSATAEAPAAGASAPSGTAPSAEAGSDEPSAAAPAQVAAAPADQPAATGESPPTADASASGEPEVVPAGNVTIETVEVEEPGRLMLGGKAEPGDAVRLYLNNEQLADVETAADGRWTLSTERPMPPGRYELRADVVASGTGSVTARAQVRFDRIQLVAADGSGAAAGATGEAGQPGSGVTIVSRAGGLGASQSGPVGAGAGTSVIVIARGDSLWQIARKIYGQGVRHTVIYEANKNQIGNPNLIYPGQVFTIPVLDDSRSNG